MLELKEYSGMQVEYFIFPVPSNDNINTQHYKHNSNSTVENIAIPRLEYMQRLESKIFYYKSIIYSIDIVISRYKSNSEYMYILNNRYLKKKNSRAMSHRAIGVTLGYSLETIRKKDQKIIREINIEIMERTSPRMTNSGRKGDFETEGNSKITSRIDGGTEAEVKEIVQA